MQSIPEWVPTEVLDFYHSLSGGPWDQLDIQILEYALTSTDMKRAWSAISRRVQTVNPQEFARAILTVSSLARGLDKYPTTAKIDAHYEIAGRVRRLANKIEKVASETIKNDWNDERNHMLLGHIFKMPPFEALEEFAEYFEITAQDMDETRTELTAYVGKPGAKDAKRVYVIRMLSAEVRRLYNQPLHETVALTSAEIVGEDIDIELVRKLVKTHDNLEPPYWAG